MEHMEVIILIIPGFFPSVKFVMIQRVMHIHSTSSTLRSDKYLLVDGMEHE